MADERWSLRWLVRPSVVAGSRLLAFSPTCVRPSKLRAVPAPGKTARGVEQGGGAELVALPRLRSLDLTRTGGTLDDAAADALTGALHELCELSVAGSELLSPAAVGRMRQAWPGARIDTRDCERLVA